MIDFVVLGKTLLTTPVHEFRLSVSLTWKNKIFQQQKKYNLI